MQQIDLENIRPRLEKIALSCQVDWWGIEWSSEYGRPVLRVYVDRAGGVDLDALAAVTREINAFLDADDPFPGISYTLEVSSPGLERRLFTLEQCSRYVGSVVKAKAGAPIGGRKRFRGRLAAVEAGGMLCLEEENGDAVRLPFSALAEVRLVYGGWKDE